MRKQQKQLELEKRVNASGIFKAMAQLKDELGCYEQSARIKYHSYTVKCMLETVEKSSRDLKMQLEELLRNAETWEALE